MATMWPHELPTSIRQSRQRRAEVRVYDKLAEVLDDTFTVFYSSPWLGVDHLGAEKDGECDFLVAHIRFGYVAIEVKGGGIAFDPKTGAWTSTDAYNFEHTIKDPVNQARSAKHEILKRLKDGGYGRFVHAAHGVVFPDASAPLQSLGADRPANLFCCSPQLASGLREWIGERLGERIQAARREVFGADGVDKLRRMLAYPFQLNFSVSASMTDAAEQLGALEPAQFHILDHISDVARAEIRGGAGTGKTVIAAEEAARLATAGNRTLLTCYSAPLAKELGRRLRNVPNLTVATFHAVCSQRAAAAGIQIDRNAKGQDLFDNVLPSALMDAMSMRPEDRWQAIVVDEGQDFLDTWWIALATALLPDGSIRVMSDTNQRVYGARRAPWPDLQLVPIRLISNLRNTKAIHRAAIAHYEGPEITPLGPDGSEANWIVSSDESALCSAAASELVRLVDKERVSPGDIAVLVPAANWIETFRQTAAHTGLEFSTCDDLTSEHVVVDTVRRFKGLERQATILVVSSADLSGTELAYVGMSRPRTYLTVIATDHDIQWLKPKPVSLGSKR